MDNSDIDNLKEYFYIEN